MTNSGCAPLPSSPHDRWSTGFVNLDCDEGVDPCILSDPSFAPAFAFLGAAHVVDYINGWSAFAESRSLEDAREAARRTVVLDERYPTAHWALAGVNLWSRQHDEAIREAERSISLNPNYADGHNFLGLILHYSGRSEHSSIHFDRAMALEPLFPGRLAAFPGASGLPTRTIRSRRSHLETTDPAQS